MFRSLAAFVVLAVPALAFAQQSAPLNIRNEPMEHVSACLSHAIGAGALHKSGQSIAFSCYGLAATNFFNFLRSKSSYIETYPSSGTYRTRYTGERGNGADRCFQQIETADGKATSGAFGCEIYLFVGPVIND